MLINFPEGRGELPRILNNDDGEEMTEPLHGNRNLQFFPPNQVNTYAPLRLENYEDVMNNRFAPALDSACDGWSICYNFGTPLWCPPPTTLPGAPADPLNDLEKRWHHGRRRQFFLSMRVNDLHHCHYNRPRFWPQERIDNRRFFIGPVPEDFWNNTLMPWVKEGQITPPKKTENGLAWVTHYYEGHTFPELKKEALTYDFTFDEVRDLYVKQLEEAFRHCDADGVELDFLRFWWLFPAGKARPELVTEWIARIRELCLRRAAEVGHPIKLVARILANPVEQQQHGHDVETWLKRGFFDAVIVGRGFLYSHPCIKAAYDLAHRYNCFVYGSFDSGHFCHTRFRTPLALRGAIAAMWAQGADGIYFFNHNAPSEYYLFDEAADPETLKTLPKEFFVDTGCLNDWPWPSGGLPAKVPAGVSKFILCFGDEPAAAERFQMDYVTSGPFPKSVKINGKAITDRNTPGQATSRYRAEVQGAVIQGHNTVEVEFDEPVTLNGIGITSVPQTPKA